MSNMLKKLWNDYGIVGAIVALVIVYGIYMVYKNLAGKGIFGNEPMTQSREGAYNNKGGVEPSLETGNEDYSSIDASMRTSGAMTQNPLDLLPKDNNTQFGQLNPSGKGDLANINLLKAGYHIGIDTIGQSLRNPNLQLRAEPPNPILNTGPWNQSTIEPNNNQVDLQIGR